MSAAMVVAQPPAAAKSAAAAYGARSACGLQVAAARVARLTRGRAVQPPVALRSPARRACHAGAVRRAPPPLRCLGDSQSVSVSGGGDSTALAQPLAAYATRPVYVLTEPITFDKLTALMVLGIPWARVMAWGVMMFMAYTLRHFLGLAGGTFILSFMGNSVVNVGATRWPGRRRLVTVLWFGVVILALVGFGLVTIPSITHEGAELVHRIQSENPYVLLGDKLRSALGADLTAKLERFLSLLTVSSSPPAGASQAEVLASLAAVDESVVGELASGWGAEHAHRLGTVLQAALKQHTTVAVNVISAGLAATTRFTLQGLVSLVLSFVIVWDMPAIRRGIESLAHSRLSWLYAETAPALTAFGHLFGKALQAQCLVAAVNTALTASGMLFLQLPGVAFLSLIVFFCSFIPVAGVIISTVPIGFVALTEFGVGRLLAVIMLVIVAHAVEAYLLNPAIYAAHLKLHPLIVLVVLVVAEHTLGVWGLLLAVPVTVFTLEVLIKTPEQRAAEEQQAQARQAAAAAAIAARLQAAQEALSKGAPGSA